LERIETAWRAIKRYRRALLGDRSARAIDRSPQIERSVISFLLVPKLVTLNDLERRDGHYLALFHWIW